MQPTRGRFLAPILSVVILGAGCAHLVPPVAIPSAPPVGSSHPRVSLSPALKTNLLWHAWPLPEGHDPLDARFREAREALWNYDTTKATNLFRSLLDQPRPPIPVATLKQLIAQCHELDGDWAAAAQAYEEMGLAKVRPGSIRHARLLAEKPHRSIRFSGEATPLPFELVRGQWVLVSVQVGSVRGRFLMDTGFSTTLLTKAFARSVGVEELDSFAQIEDGNGRVRRAPWGFVPELRLGPMSAQNVPVITSDRNSFPGIPGKIDGVIGWDLLQHADLTFDFPARTLEVREPSGPIVPEPNLAGRHVPAIRALNGEGKVMDLFLDTGYADSIGKFIFTDTAGSLEQLVDPSTIRRQWKPSFTFSLNSFRVRFPRRVRPAGFWFSGHTFVRPAADIRRMSGTDSLEPRRFDGMVGNAPFTSGTLRLVGTRRLATYRAAEERPASP
jgi:hypothetical protein